MSIINDALKKTQQNLNLKTSPLAPKQKAMGLWIIVSLITFGLIACSLIIFSLISPKESQKPLLGKTKTPALNDTDSSSEEPKKEETATPREISAPPRQKTLRLTGIMQLGDELFALINDEIRKEGDSIEGKKIERITVENVQFLDENGQILLLKPGER